MEKKYETDPAKYNHLYSMVKEEVDCKTAKDSSSCTNGLLWLTRYIISPINNSRNQSSICFISLYLAICKFTILMIFRAMDFLVELFRNLLAHLDWTMTEACTDSYGKTLKKFHGWIASSAFTVNSFVPIWLSFFWLLYLFPDNNLWYADIWL